jgi:uncharacterized protein (DUF1015 family)
MAEIRPFRGLRYDTEQIGADAMRDVVAPPYDVIDDAGQDALYARHPKNFVRVDLNRITESDHDENNRYTRSRRYLMDWLAEGVMRFEDKPAIYVHHQTFTDAAGNTYTRKGFLAAIRLAEYDEKIVLPHERTLRGPKVDRLELMKATECHLSPVFLLYDDTEGAVDDMLESAVSGSDAVRIETEDDGIEHVLWTCTDEEVIAQVTAQLADDQVLIADGHHRYETALAYRDFRREVAEEADADAPYEFALAFFVNFRDPGLAVFPTHRVIYGVDDFDLSAVWSKLEEHADFEVESIDASDLDEVRATLAAAGNSQPSFVLYGRGGDARLVKFVGDTSSEIFDDETPDEVRELDVAVLHEGVIDRILGISKEAQAAKTNLNYIKGWEPAAKALDDASNQLVVLMNPTPVEQVDRVCRSGGVMPQKSTFFYPKILSGLLVHPA